MDPLPELDLHSIRIVRAIAEHGSISAAARALGYSQPAISQHLRRAETRLGTPLVLRSGRGVRLTEPGLVLARHAHAIGSALDAAGGELAELVGLRAGSVRIAAFPTASSTLVPRLLRELRARHPRLRVGYVEAEPPEALGMLRDAAVDLAITFAYPGDRADPHREAESMLTTTRLSAEPVVLALPASHPLARDGGPVSLTRLGDERWIAGCPLCRGHLLAACEAVGVEPDIHLETDNAIAVLNLVAAGLGVALLPRLALATAPVPEGAAIRATSPSSDRSIRVVTQTGADRVPSIQAALAAIRALDTRELGLESASVSAG
ncbi:LysR family transcriptional regulator [Homoserinibacter sp. YIM 151385]|uniref:LysR family transcriptional regulator n=1 Tax=Homoserinibacter sp. YIM 151385 TaxID=2985506 RepID=UPI0022F0643D|nr:LysR family transcriptional regulator [Homoserinibacter sp. YIM 151385]WBU38419.1 LysR family transcriptional regulator [Homoserinibacter sp. YIM 151385]